MKDKELLAQLNRLKDHRPSPLWLQTNRERLASQLYSGQNPEPALTWLVKANLLSRLVFQPQYVAVMITIFFAASGLFGYKASQASGPGDSLYIAKRISERAQLMLAFSDASKTKLNVEFAGKRVEELKTLINAEPQLATDQPAKLADLKASAEAEIKVARERLVKSTPSAATTAPTVSDNQEFKAAEATKDNERLDISLPDLPDEVPTSTKRTPEAIIDEAVLLLGQDQLDKVSEKLSELNQLIK